MVHLESMAEFSKPKDLQNGFGRQANEGKIYDQPYHGKVHENQENAHGNFASGHRHFARSSMFRFLGS